MRYTTTGNVLLILFTLGLFVAFFYTDLSREFLNATAYTIIIFGGTAIAIFSDGDINRDISWKHWVAYCCFLVFHVSLLYYLLWILELHIPYWVYVLLGLPEGYVVIVGISMIDNVQHDRD